MGEGALTLDIDDIFNCIKTSARQAANEEEVRHRVSNCIENKILKPLGVTYDVKLERTLISGAREDALYGHVIVEYKAPGKLSSLADVEKAKEQIIRYVKEEAGSQENWGKYLGVMISDRIGFVRYYKSRGWVLRGPYEITRESVVKLVEAIRGLRRKELRVDLLVEDFGPQSQLAGKIKVLYTKLLSPMSPRTNMVFEEWLRLLRQATGYSPEKLEALKGLAKEYGIEGKVDYDRLMFAIHTYYALILKLLAAEVVYIYGGGRFYKSYIAELDDAYTKGGVEALREVLEDLESGGVFRQFGVENFLEGDYFSWYLGELDRDLADAVAEIARKLGEFEPATPQLEPESARDLLKRLYQQLIPDDIRHSLGEYYTPDWLADFLLDEVGLDIGSLERMGAESPLQPLELRILDPACGSGTFLVRYMSRLREYAREHFLDDVLLDYTLRNVVGYDLNPLAVLTARTNYLMMIADLPRRRAIEIPIYLADSLMVEKSSTLEGSVYVLKTVAGEFRLPASIVEKGLLSDVLSEAANALKSKYRVEDFVNRIRHRFKDVTDYDAGILGKFYEALLRLEQEEKNGIWVSIIRNAFAPVLKGKFDYVVGNPPWVNWESLPEEYREISKDLWSLYGLTEIRGVGLGKVKRDLAMLFLARGFDLYLKPGGRLGFLMPFTSFKTQAGAGFRKFLATRTKIDVVHDLVTLYPFEGAVNRTSAIVVEKPCELSDVREGRCPAINKILDDNKKVRHVIWINKTGKPVPIDEPLEDVLASTERFEGIMTPISRNDPSSSWMQTMDNVLPYIEKVTSGKSPYRAYEGVNVALNQVYYVQVKEKLPDGKLLITNPPEPGQKKNVRQVDVAIEPDLIYPLIRGRDVKRWYVDYKNRYIIVPHDPKTGKPLPEGDLKIKLPLAYGYLNMYRKELENRSVHKLWGKGNPFYAIYDIGSYTFAPYKVVWRRIAGAITGKATEFACAVVEPANARAVVPDDGTIMIPFDGAEEAYYVAGILNSSIIKAIIASYTYELRQETHIIENVKIPKFNHKEQVHRRITELSKRAHELTTYVHARVKPDSCKDIRNSREELGKVEDELDRAVAELYGIPEEALVGFRRMLEILSGEEIPKEAQEAKD